MRKGFSLIEMMIVIAICVILIAMVVPHCNGNRQHTNVTWDTQCYLKQEKVFDGVTDRKAKFVGDTYWKVDGEMIYANICESERRSDKISEITPIN